jgi:hypothetical protein
LELAQHMNLQGSEAAAERDLLGRGDALVAEHQHVIVEMGATDARDIILAKGPGQVEADHFGAKGRVDWPDVEAGKGAENGGHKRAGSLIENTAYRPHRRADNESFQLYKRVF